MVKRINLVVSFVAGITVGVVATYKIAEAKYKKIADEEIESVVEVFTNRKPQCTDISHSEPTSNVQQTKEEISKYKQKVGNLSYNTISNQSTKNNKEVVDEMPTTENNDKIYTISPDEFNTLDGFGIETFYYSADNYLLDSDNEIVPDSDMNTLLGGDPYGRFGEYEDDSVYVRNEDTMCDYEILLSAKTCAEIMEG